MNRKGRNKIRAEVEAAVCGTPLDREAAIDQLTDAIIDDHDKGSENTREYANFWQQVSDAETAVDEVRANIEIGGAE